MSHYTDARDGITAAERVFEGESWLVGDLETPKMLLSRSANALAEAQVHATLAVADELRTANLIAAAGELAVRVGMSDGVLAAARAEILRRLDLGDQK